MKNSIQLLLLAALCSCAQANRTEEASVAEATADTENVQAQTIPAQGTQSAAVPNDSNFKNVNTRLIRQADYHFEVKDIQLANSNIDGYVARFPAYIASTNLSMEGSQAETTMVIRVQSDYFNELMLLIDKEASSVVHRNIKVEDVSKQFVDLEARLKTKKEVQARYEQILRTKAGTVKELLDAEQQIGQIQEEIESTIARLTYLRDQVNYSTITLRFFQHLQAPVSSTPGTIEKFAEAFSGGLKGVVNFAIAITYLWPFFVLVSLVIFFLKKKKHFLRNRLSLKDFKQQ